jgi:quinol-cytochrome oxidoreductase complex cytochrome b subunit
VFRVFFWLFVFTCIGLGWLGSQEITDAYVLSARILAICYFAFFLIVLPLLGLFETTKPVPPSIADAVLARTKGDPARETVGPGEKSAI